MNETTMKTRKKSADGNSVVEDDLKDHFSVLNELSARLEEYYAMPTIPAESGEDYYG